MKQIQLGNIKVPSLALGCMRINGIDNDALQNFISKAVDNGLNFFDHADIYGDGKCEEVFGNALKNLKISRDKVIIQSKCGIVPGVMYDFSQKHILQSVDGILSRLNTEYLDLLLLHRPDALIEPQEVGEAFEKLYKAGKVRQFGVSNMRPYQIELLQKFTTHKLVANQLQLSPTNANLISQGFEVNMSTQGAVDRDGGVLDYCRLNDITVQAWSPFQYGFFEGVYINNEKFPDLNNVLQQLSQKYNTNVEAIVIAWFCRHPANIQTVCGSTNIDRVLAMAQGADIQLTREEWYKIYLSAGHILP